MLSPIDGNTVTSNPRAQPQSSDPSDGPISVVSPETDLAPQGRVIDDSARGTIFWEAEHSDEGRQAKNLQDELSAHEKEGVEQDWGKPFRIEWQSTNRVPFYRTRGLRNPWNANREIKIARDGQELEYGIGRKLISMFHRPASGAPPPGYPTQISPPAVAMGTTQGIGRQDHQFNASRPSSDGPFVQYGIPR